MNKKMLMEKIQSTFVNGYLIFLTPWCKAVTGVDITKK